MRHEVFVVRHGETEWNHAGRLQGRLDSPLTPTGRMQAASMGEWLAGRAVADHILLASPLGRARATAEIIASRTGLELGIDPDLAEIGVGAWEGLTFEQILARGGAMRDDEDHLTWCARAPGGEGLTALMSRVAAVISRIDRPSILVCHGLFSRVLRAEMQGVAADEVEGGQGVIFRIQHGRSERIDPVARKGLQPDPL